MNIQQEALHQAISDTMGAWGTKTKDEFFFRTCPLCEYIKKSIKKPLYKGSARGTCLYCIVKFANLFSLCTAIQSLRDNSHTIADVHFEDIKKMVQSKLAILEEMVYDKDTFDKYIKSLETSIRYAPHQPKGDSYMETKRQPKIKKAKKPVPLKTQRIFKVQHRGQK